MLTAVLSTACLDTSAIAGRVDGAPAAHIDRRRTPISSHVEWHLGEDTAKASRDCARLAPSAVVAAVRGSAILELLLG